MISQDSLHILKMSMCNSLTSTVVSTNWFKFQTLEPRARSSKSELVFGPLKMIFTFTLSQILFPNHPAICPFLAGHFIYSDSSMLRLFMRNLPTVVKNLKNCNFIDHCTFCFIA